MVDRGANIDIFFRNGLREYEVLPPADVWDNIRPGVTTKKSPVLFLRAAAITGIILSAGFLYYYLPRGLSPVLTGQAVTLNQDSRPEGNYKATKSNNPQLQNLINPSDGTLLTADQAGREESPSPVFFSLAEPSLFTSFLEENRSRTQRNRGDMLADNKDLTINFVPPADENGTLPEKSLVKDASAKTSRWRIGAMIAPTYYSTLDFGRDEAVSALANTENPSISYSAGFSFGYSLSKRFVLQTGVYYSSVEQKISGIAAFSGFNRYNETKGNSSFSVLTSNGPITVGNSDIFVMNSDMVDKVLTAYTADVFDPFKSDLDFISNSLIQNINYIEIPIVLRYKFIDKRLGLNVVGGFSYNLLLDNSAYAITGGTRNYVGKTDGLSPISFTSSIGMGMEYNITGKLSLNLEPTFRYYVTPLGDLAGSSVHPYSFAILSGVSYKF